MAVVRRSLPLALGAVAMNGGINMAEEHVDTLRSARVVCGTKMELAIALAKPFARADTEQWRQYMIEVQATIRAIDEAMKDEEGLAAK